MSEENEWNEKLFGCFDDWGICCYGCWCPCCLFGSNASRLDGQNGCIMCCIDCNLSMYSLSWVGHLFQRYKLRQRLSLREDTRCSDLPAVMCCAYCALCQEAREMKSRGYIMDRNRRGKNHDNRVFVTTAPSNTNNGYNNNNNNSF